MREWLRRRDWVPWTWVLAAFLVGSARLFETGLSLDPAIYANVARHFARDWDWWNLKGGEFFFPQYFEQPFLSYWMQGMIFRLFGASDYTARLLGLVLGSLSFYYLFRLAETVVDRVFAHAVAGLTLISAPFVGRMATFYMEIPLMFFCLGSLFHGYRALRADSAGQGFLAGLFLGGAFLTKGLAALPMAGLLGLVAVYGNVTGFWRNRGWWSLAGGALLITGGFCLLQSRYGSYSLWERYINTGLFGKAIRPRMSPFTDVATYFWKLFLMHPLHGLVALAAPAVVLRDRPSLREACFLGTAGTLLFGVANGLLGKHFHHYFYPMFPFVNWLAALALHPLLSRRPAWPWHRYAVGFGLVYQVAWNLIPVPSRQKPWVDFFQLEGVVSALKAQGVRRLEGLSLEHGDWIYPAMSLWYWDVDTKPIARTDEASGSAVVVDKGEGGRGLEGRGYVFCAGSSRYRLYVKPASLAETCRTAALNPRWLR